MTVFLIIAIILAVLYTMLMLVYRSGWEHTAEFIPHGNFTPQTTISIIIPARNEEDNIVACLESIMAQDYPAHLFDVIVIDDHSTDKTYDVVNGLGYPNISCIKLADHMQQGEELVAYKKKALTTGIAQSDATLIITTDADCIMSQGWLKSIAEVYEADKPVMVAGPVDFTCNGSMVQTFQSIDFMSMQGITAATLKLKLGNMSNGANLAFSREAFHAVNGYEGVDHLASGDDYLLMMKLTQNYGTGIRYLKSKQAIVHTAPQPDWNSFLQQRIRWASKSGKYDDKKMTGVLSFVYLFNFYFLVLLVAALFIPTLWLVLAALFVVKTVAEFIYLFPVASFFHKRGQLWYFVVLQPLHITYIITAGFLGFAGIYTWKGRRVR